MADFHFTGKQLIEMGWDGDLNTLEHFKEMLKSMLELGWNPEEMSLQEFAIRWGFSIKKILSGFDDPEEIVGEKEPDCNNDYYKEDDLETRRRRAEEAGWDEEEMDLEEFEDYFMK